jgi:PBP1b-binding outer membrane lipoprotein LpoB
MRRLTGVAITAVFLAGCASHVAPKRTTFSAPAERVLIAKAGPAFRPDI